MTEAFTRHTAAFPCGVCDGHAGLPHGRGVRCAGFTLDLVIYCTREEYAGSLPFEMSVSPGAYKHARFGRCGCGASHGWGSGARDRTTHARPPIASVEDRDAIYSFALGLLPLRENARHDLRRRGLTDEMIADWRFRSIPMKGKEHQDFMRSMTERFGEDALRLCPGVTDKNKRLTFWGGDARRDGYIVPYINEHAQITGIQQKCFDGRYLSPAGAQLDAVYSIAGDARPGSVLHLTEGGLKAIVANELAQITVLAVAGQSLKPAHIDVIKRLDPETVVVCLDREDNTNTARARLRWLDTLASAGLPTFEGVWEGGDVAGPKALDDLCVTGGRPRFRRWNVLPSAMGRRRTPREVPIAGDVDRGVTIVRARTIVGSAIEEFITNAETHRGEALLVRAAPGTAKTHSTAGALKDSRAHARIVVGTMRLAQDLADEFGYAAIQGRNEQNCGRFDVVQALAAGGHPIEELACGTKKQPRCPMRDRCLYLRQFDGIGTRVAASEQLYNPRFLAGGSVVVADDADLVRSSIERHQITVPSLERAVRGLARRRRKQARSVLALVARALLTVQLDDVKLPLLGARVWDEFVKDSRRYNHDFCAAVASLPKNGTLPPPGKSQKDVLNVGDVEEAVPATMGALLDVLSEELPRFLCGDDFNSQLKIDHDGLHVSRLRQPAVNKQQQVVIAEMPFVILEATPVEALVDHVTVTHARLPDVSVDVELPANVTVVQHAGSSGGRTVLKQPQRAADVLAEVAAEREHYPISSSEKEAAICFGFLRGAVENVGIAAEQILTFGAVRGLNRLASVERLQVIGRPMAPMDELLYLAQVIHHDEPAVSSQIVVEPRRYGGQRFEVDVVDFEDGRAAALVKATRDDELVQVIHRARLYDLLPQQHLFERGRESVRLVLHTGHPIPGLRVDELHVTALRRDVNEERENDAEDRIRTAIERLQRDGKEAGVNAIAKAARADKRTVGKALGKPVDTLRKISNNRVHHLPQTAPDQAELAADGLCLGCGVDLPQGNRKCSTCAARAVRNWNRRRTG